MFEASPTDQDVVRAWSGPVSKGFSFYCPGCDDHHSITIERTGHTGPSWGWNGSKTAPTFTPSILVKYPANPDATEEFKEWRKERICHSFITDGKIQYLNDCTHTMAGQTVQLPSRADRTSDPFME